MSLTILYVEDHKLVADAVKDALEAAGWRVVLCVDGAAALSLIFGQPLELMGNRPLLGKASLLIT